MGRPNSTCHSKDCFDCDTARRAPAYPVVSADHYMLRLAVLKELEHVAAALDATIGRRRVPCAEPEQRLKGRHGLLPPIVSKDELVQVRLELRAANAVIGAD